VHRVIGELLPLALVVAVSPINIIAAILLLFSKRPIAGASCYLAGFFLGVLAVLVALDTLARHIDLLNDSAPSKVGAVIRIVIGIGLLYAAIRKLVARFRKESDGELPSWMSSISEFSPPKAAATGLLIGALNPKNLAMAVAASLTIGAVSLSIGQTAAIVAVYVVIASLGVAAPLVVALALGDRADPVLTGWRTWLSRNNDLVMAVLYAVFSVVLIGNGITYL
jgi:hypothetical protein